jgi:hypothetical protein
MTYFRCLVNYFVQGFLVYILYFLQKWGFDAVVKANDEAVRDENDVAENADCWKLIGPLHLICIWLHTTACLIDMKQTINMAEVVLFLFPTVEGASEVFRFEKVDGAPVRRSGGMNKLRKTCLFFAVIVPKFLISFLVLWFGASYLSASGTNPDLILNALALIFITDIDEQVSAFLAPARISRLMETFPAFEVDTLDNLSEAWRYSTEYSTIINMTVSMFMCVWFRLWPAADADRQLCKNKWSDYDHYFPF